MLVCIPVARQMALRKIYAWGHTWKTIESNLITELLGGLSTTRRCPDASTGKPLDALSQLPTNAVLHACMVCALPQLLLQIPGNVAKQSKCIPPVCQQHASGTMQTMHSANATPSNHAAAPASHTCLQLSTSRYCMLIIRDLYCTWAQHLPQHGSVHAPGPDSASSWVSGDDLLHKSRRHHIKRWWTRGPTTHFVTMHTCEYIMSHRRLCPYAPGRCCHQRTGSVSQA